VPYVINKLLENSLNYNNRTLKDLDRLQYFLKLGLKEISRKVSMNISKNLSFATASRDLQNGFGLNMFESFGNLKKQNTYYNHYCLQYRFSKIANFVVNYHSNLTRNFILVENNRF
jgi:hypothetical protein